MWDVKHLCYQQNGNSIETLMNFDEKWFVVCSASMFLALLGLHVARHVLLYVIVTKFPPNKTHVCGKNGDNHIKQIMINGLCTSIWCQSI